MDKNTLKKKNFEDINRISVKCMRIMGYFLGVFYGLMVFIGDIKQKPLTVAVLICFVLILIPCIVIPLFRLYGNGMTRYILVIVSTLIAVMLVTVVGKFAYPLILFPIILASLYFDRTFVLFTSFVLNAGILGSVYYQVTYGSYSESDVYDLFLNEALPLIIIVIFVTFIVFFIVSRNAMMMEKYIDSAITMHENEKYLIFAFSEISENKSKETGEHIQRVAEYMRVLGRASGFDDEYIEKLATASMMHDIGKLMINEEILDKPGKLTDEEYETLKNHVLYGEALLANCPGEIMRLASIMAKEHHERWDGKGYLKMQGEEIAYIARMMSICDVFDALTMKRSYKRAWTVEEAYDEIIKGTGKQFDPQVVRLFIQNFDKFKEIHARIPDKQIL